jgi:threonylcarbamoyladenosine tRNA methylthiotransferase MtaB
MQIHLATLGCRLNEAELERWARQLRGAGYGLAEEAARADAIVLNTCAVTNEAGRKSRHLIRRLHRESPGAQILVTGCYAQLARADVAALPGVVAVIDNAQKDDLLAHLPPLADGWQPAQAQQPYAPSRARAFLKVQDGCRNRCTFCVVTIARGEERSRPIAEVVEEVRRLHAEGGYEEVVLTGVHLGGYGSDLGSDLRALIAAVLAEAGVPRVRLGSLEPWDIPDGFWGLWGASGGRLCPHLHLPLQSGCDATLRRMARRCDTARYAALVAEARAQIPHLAVSTDLIVGFPGETDAEWAQTLEFIRAVGFAHVHLFSFSARPGTTAARLKGRVAPAVIQARMAEAKEAAGAMKRAHLSAQVGAMAEVLWETASEVEPEAATAAAAQGYDSDGARVWEGYTDNFTRVAARAPGAWALRGQRALTLLTGVAADGQHLTGHILRREARQADAPS